MNLERAIDELRRELEEMFPMKDCGVCHAEVTMVRVEAFPEKDGPVFKGYKCLKCCTLYQEVLQEVKPDAR